MTKLLFRLYRRFPTKLTLALVSRVAALQIPREIHYTCKHPAGESWHTHRWSWGERTRMVAEGIGRGES